MATYTVSIQLADRKVGGEYQFDSPAFEQYDITEAELNFMFSHGAYRVRAIDGVAYSDARDEVVLRHRAGLVTFG